MTPSLSIPQHPISPNWQHAFGGVWRLTFRRFIGPKNLLLMAALLAGLGLLAFGSTSHGHANTATFQEWIVKVYLSFALPVAAFILSAGMIRDDLTPATVDYVLTRPIRRPLFVVFRYVSTVVTFELLCLCSLGILVAVGVNRGIPDVREIALATLAAQLLAIPAFCAMGFAFGSFTGRYLVIGLLYWGIVETSLGHIPTQLSRVSMTHNVQTLAANLSGIPLPGSVAESSAAAVAGLLGFSVIMLAIAAVRFTLLEMTGSQAKDQ